GWWRNNAPANLIVPGAYDFPRKKKDTRNFPGDVLANIETGGNIIAYIQSRHHAGVGARIGIIPHMYRPGSDPSRPDYEKIIMSAYPQFVSFVTCLKKNGGEVYR